MANPMGWKTRGIMARIERIPKADRCEYCAGFGFVYRCNKSETVIREVHCKPCKGKGRRLEGTPDKSRRSGTVSGLEASEVGAAAVAQAVADLLHKTSGTDSPRADYESALAPLRRVREHHLVLSSREA